MKKLGRPPKRPEDAFASGVTASLDPKTFMELDALVEITGIRRASLFRTAIHNLLAEHKAAIRTVLHKENVES
jgi:hypothetical protein